jgi:hypothetical protein
MYEGLFPVAYFTTAEARLGSVGQVHSPSHEQLNWPD